MVRNVCHHADNSACSNNLYDESKGAEGQIQNALCPTVVRQIAQHRATGVQIGRGDGEEPERVSTRIRLPLHHQLGDRDSLQPADTQPHDCFEQRHRDSKSVEHHLNEEVDGHHKSHRFFKLRGSAENGADDGRPQQIGGDGGEQRSGMANRLLPK
ncbi:hypothetical protein ON010_g3978 [Phytophthora cinnamomi]|nr:hypothetical protein ON010_g3978 [Phytophthora cinnamomi]